MVMRLLWLCCPNVNLLPASLLFSILVVAAFADVVAKTFNGYYHDHSILREENPAVRRMRLRLAGQVARVIRSGMRLLGIDVPERM